MVMAAFSTFFFYLRSTKTPGKHCLQVTMLTQRQANTCLRSMVRCVATLLVCSMFFNDDVVVITVNQRIRSLEGKKERKQRSKPDTNSLSLPPPPSG